MVFLNLPKNGFSKKPFFIFPFHIYKCLKNYQLNIIKKIKKDLKKAHERYQIFLNKKKEKSGNMVVNVAKIFQKMKNKSLLSIEQNIIE